MKGFVALLVSVGSLMGATVASSAEIAVTIRVESYFDPGSAIRRVALGGNVSSRAAGEVVEVLTKQCGVGLTG